MNTRIIRFLFGTITALAIALLLLVLPIPTPASAAPSMTFTVNSNSDVADGNPGNGICETSNGNGVCTLRAAITEANVTSGSTINFGLGGSVIYLLTLGELNITSTVSIVGNGAANTIIDANANSRVFEISPGVVANISGVTIRNGRSNQGGGIYNHFSTLSLANSVVISNAATNSFPQNGGGIFNEGTLMIINSSINNNSAPFASGGLVGGGGGGIYQMCCTLQLINTLMDSNTTSNNGGAIQVSAGTVSLFNSTLNSNIALDGGGIFVDTGFGPTTLVTITNSGIFSNTASNTPNTAGGGGGIYNLNGTATLINSTMYLNAANTWGGGLFNDNSGMTSATTRFWNSTITANFADYDGNNTGIGGGIYQNGGTVTIRNTILAGNYNAGFCISCTTPDDCGGTLTSEDFNLIQTVNCTISGATGNNKNGVDPQFIYPIAYNGGPTLNLALLPGSPAIDAGNTGGCRDGLGALIPTDQRGWVRPYPLGGLCDIGAYERGAFLFLPLIKK